VATREREKKGTQQERKKGQVKNQTENINLIRTIVNMDYAKAGVSKLRA
jgi:hypothetical protein